MAGHLIRSLLLTLFSLFAAIMCLAQTAFDIYNCPAPLFRDPIFDGSADPTLIWNKSINTWHMFYTQRRASKADLPGVAYCYGTAIGIANSADHGKTWTYMGTANLPQPDEGLNSFWAPQVVYDKKSEKYHMFVTYIKGVFSDWGGERQLFHYTSSNLKDWTFEEKIGTSGCIDASVIQLEDSTWKMWYKDEKRGSHTFSATSKDLMNWTLGETDEVKSNAHEGPVIFKFENKYWMITDMWNGLNVYESENAQNWNLNNTILSTPGNRPDDNVMGRHADVQVIGNRIFIFYFTHPGRIYENGKEVNETTYRFKRSSIQIAELELIGDIMICNRNKYVLRQ